MSKADMTANLIVKFGRVLIILVVLGVLLNIFDFVFHHERHVDLNVVKEYSERFLELPEADIVARDLKLCIKHKQYNISPWNSDCEHRRDSAIDIAEAIISCEQAEAHNVRLCETIIPWGKKFSEAKLSIMQSLKILGISKSPINFKDCDVFDSLENRYLKLYWSRDAKSDCIKNNKTRRAQ